MGRNDETVSDFGERDLDLLLAVLSMHDSLLGAAQAVKHAERAISYPLHAVEDLRPVFRQRGPLLATLRFASCSVNFDDARRFLPEEAFPIDSREELISAVVSAFEAGQAEHLAAAHAEQASARTATDAENDRSENGRD